jgi:hypothetical protein
VARPPNEALDLIIANSGDPYQMATEPRVPVPSVPATEAAVVRLGRDGRWYAEALCGDAYGLSDGETHVEAIGLAQSRALEEYDRRERLRAGGADPSDMIEVYEPGPGPIAVMLDRRGDENQVAFFDAAGNRTSTCWTWRTMRSRRSAPN